MDPGPNSPISTDTAQNPTPNSISAAVLLLGSLLVIAALIMLTYLL